MSGPSDHAGHRKRLRERFLKAGNDALADYEMLELVLFQAQARRDMKPVAKALMKRFGTYANVISASPVELAEIDGIGDAGIMVLKTVQAAAQRTGAGRGHEPAGSVKLAAPHGLLPPVHGPEQDRELPHPVP